MAFDVLWWVGEPGGIQNVRFANWNLHEGVVNFVITVALVIKYHKAITEVAVNVTVVTEHRRDSGPEKIYWGIFVDNEKNENLAS